MIENIITLKCNCGEVYTKQFKLPYEIYRIVNEIKGWVCPHCGTESLSSEVITIKEKDEENN